MNEDRWQSLKEKVDKILRNTAKHSQKLDALNSKIATNRDMIHDNEDDIDWNKGKIRLAMGGIGLITLIGTFVGIYSGVVG